MKRTINKIPPMVRCSQIAKFLSTTVYWVVDFCEKHDVPIVRAGVQKIRMIPRDKFYEKLDQEKLYESIRKN